MGQAAVKDSSEYYSDGKEDQIYDWVSNCETGMMGFEFGDVPPACIDFCLEQYARFNVPLADEIITVIASGASAAFYYADKFDPYALFKGVSDVDATLDWSTHAYELHDAEGSGPSREVDPQGLETFSVVPGQCEYMFREMLGRPGLQSLPWAVGEGIAELLEGHGEEMWDAIDSETELVLRALCTPPGTDTPDVGRMRQYFELAAWAGFIWLAGPLGREYRKRHDIIACALEYGECILSDGTIAAPIYYTKHNRPPQSCHRCGVQVWCVEHTMVGASTMFICEACLNFDMPKGGFANCGTKYCKNSVCPNHPLAHMGAEGMHMILAREGQLAVMAKHGAELRLHGEIRPMLR